MNYGIIDPSCKKNSSFWQSTLWGEILLSSHQAEEFFLFGSPDGTWMYIEIRSMGMGGRGAYALGISREQIFGDFYIWLEAALSFLQKKDILFFQIEPIDNIPEILRSIHSFQTPKKAFFTAYTRTLNLLDKTTEDILIQMHEKGRYNIKLAERRGVKICKVSLSKEHIDIWMKLLTETTVRDNFSQNSQVYYESFLRVLESENVGGLYFAYLEDQVIAAGIFLFYGRRAIYYYGASSGVKEHRKHMAPYLLQWHAIQEAKNRSIPLYDFLGISDPKNPHDSLRGVTEFKEKFGGIIEQLPKKIVIPVSPIRYKIFLSFRNIRQFLRYVYGICLWRNILTCFAQRFSKCGFIKSDGTRGSSKAHI